MPRLTAAAALPLTGSYAVPARQAASGLRAWADARDVELEIYDAGSADAGFAAAYRDLSGHVDLLFGPYGSGPTRAAVATLIDAPDVLWNHGGSALVEPRGRVIDVLSPAERYWAGAAEALRSDGVDLARVAVLSGRSHFGRTVAAGAVASLAAAGAAPLLELEFAANDAAAAADRVRAAGAEAVLAGGRIDDDLALGAALAGAPLSVGLVVCGIALAAERLGAAIEGWFGAVQWAPGGPPPPIPLPAGSDYPAAQALAAGLIAERVRELAGSGDPDAVWDAARRLRTRTFLGAYGVDERGRQVAGAPSLVRWRLVGGRLERTLVRAGEGGGTLRP